MWWNWTLCCVRTGWVSHHWHYCMLSCCVSVPTVRSSLIPMSGSMLEGVSLTSVSFTGACWVRSRMWASCLPSIYSEVRWFDYIDKPLNSWANVHVCECLQSEMGIQKALRVFEESARRSFLRMCQGHLLEILSSCVYASSRVARSLSFPSVDMLLGAMLTMLSGCLGSGCLSARGWVSGWSGSRVFC